MRMILLMAGLATIPAAVQTPGALHILDAVYGDAAHARWCDATLAIGQQCDDRTNCLVSVGNGICGDPDFGTPKTLFITFKCGPGPAQTLAVTETGNVRLGCAAAAPPTT